MLEFFVACTWKQSTSVIMEIKGKQFDANVFKSKLNWECLFVTQEKCDVGENTVLYISMLLESHEFLILYASRSAT